MSLQMMMMAVMRTDIVIMMMVRFEMILNWIRIVMMMEVDNINNSISNKSSCCVSNNHDNYEDCNVGDDDDEEEEEEDNEDDRDDVDDGDDDVH